MAAPPARLPPARGAVAALAWPWFPLPRPTIASTLHRGNVALKFNSKWGNLGTRLRLESPSKGYNPVQWGQAGNPRRSLLTVVRGANSQTTDDFLRVRR